MTALTTSGPSGVGRARDVTAVSHEERLARVALNKLGEPGEVKMTSLVAELGAIRLRELLLGEAHLDGLGDDVSTRLDTVDAERDLERAERAGLRFVVPGDVEWPTRLDDLLAAGALHERGGPPIGLWVKGPVRLDSLERSLAIVGSRDATSYGDDIAGEVASTCAEAGLTIISGAAVGIDRAAHRGAVVAGGPTVAVVACGADRVYPSAHASMFDHIGREGAIVSETPPGGAPLRIRFLARNRLIAALAQGTVVAEAAKRSGALNTANWTSRLNRTLMGVPGPITSATSSGVHEQIRRGSMSLVTCGADVLELVSPAGERLVEPARDDATVRDLLSPMQRQVLDAVPVATSASSSSIARTAGLGLRSVAGALGHLAGAGLVLQDDAGWRLTELARS